MEQSESNSLTRPQMLVNWSKWLITLNFSAATGCVLVLKISNETTVQKVGPYLFMAVFFFILSVVVSTLFVLMMALSKEENDNLLLTNLDGWQICNGYYL
jgi:hypothetical protein